MQPVVSAGKYATGSKRGKVCNRWLARESMQLVLNAENREQGATVKVLNFVSGVNSLVLRMVVKRDCIEQTFALA